jgi:L-serine dehydratase
MTSARHSAYISALDLFSIGIGPSSSHTVGPMRAAKAFVDLLGERGILAATTRIECALYGSLGATGIGHGTPDAVVAGLRGLAPETCDPDSLRGGWSALGDGTALTVGGNHSIVVRTADVRLAPLTRRDGHPNTMTLRAFDAHARVLAEETYFSIGGGFITQPGTPDVPQVQHALPYPYNTAAELLDLCARHSMSIAEIALANESALRSPDDTGRGLDAIWHTMRECMDAGISTEGTLPGGLAVPRRAGMVARALARESESGHGPNEREWLHVYAMAVNEENAAGHRVVTAPTNGAAGIIPAVVAYYLRITPSATPADIRMYLLTATAIGSLFKSNASISGAEGGCQAEVGSASAMAAAGLCALFGGTPAQIENAAEIAMEHNLGLTCDPVGGLVQIPCIERNALAATKAFSAARLSLYGDGTHIVSLDMVIETMRQTGVDMSSKYKETSTGGLAVNVVEC